MTTRWIVGVLVWVSPVWGQAAVDPVRFTEAREVWGLPPGPAARVRLVDLDGDGWLDAVIDNARVYRNVPTERGRRFEELPDALPVRPDLLLFADLDDDGDQDALCAYTLDLGAEGAQDSGVRTHVRLQEDGVFVEGPANDFPPEPVLAGAWLDADRDGRLDLVTACTYVSGQGRLAAGPLRLYRGLGGGRFAVTDALGWEGSPGDPLGPRPVYGVATADMDGDGWTDVLVCGYGRQRNLLLRNLGFGRFEDVGVVSGFAGDANSSGAYTPATRAFFLRRYRSLRMDEPPFRAHGNTFDAAVADYDDDGDLDVFLAEITHAWAGPSSDRSSLLTQGPGPHLRFARDPEAAPRVHADPLNWNQGDLHAGWLDADHDGRQDLLIASSDYPDGQVLRLFRQHRPGAFRDVGFDSGLRWLNASQISLGDVDRDGDVDLLVGTNHARLPSDLRERWPLRPGLFLNQSPPPEHHWLTVRLVGAGAEAGGANRQGIDAVVVVEAGGRRLTRIIAGGRGHAGHDDAREAYFGLGEAETVDRLIVRWPDARGSRTIQTDVPADQLVVVVQDPQ